MPEQYRKEFDDQYRRGRQGQDSGGDYYRSRDDERGGRGNDERDDRFAYGGDRSRRVHDEYRTMDRNGGYNDRGSYSDRTYSERGASDGGYGDRGYGDRGNEQGWGDQGGHARQRDWSASSDRGWGGADWNRSRQDQRYGEQRHSDRGRQDMGSQGGWSNGGWGDREQYGEGRRTGSWGSEWPSSGGGSSYGRRSQGSSYDYSGSQRGGQDYGQNYGQGNGGSWNQSSSWSGGSSSDQWSPGRSSRSSDESFFGRGPKGYKRSDDRIRESVSDALMDAHEVDATEISVQVKDGEVTLTGTVRNRDQKRRAEELVEQLSGVNDVTNNLKVQREQDNNKDRQSASSTSSESSTTSGTSTAANRGTRTTSPAS
ncbi:MAG: BON domain-containing protein [Acidobacteria bacterium]|nr:BON domain-containing protein [Acidobacteriota bacterium]